VREVEDHIDARSVEILHKLGLTEDMVRDHVFLPDHVRSAALRIELWQAGDADHDPIDAPPPSGLFYRLNVGRLGRDLHKLLSGCLAGYSLQLRRYGRILLDQQWNWARTPVDGDVAWAGEVPMHVASVSKLITAMAMTKLLHSRNISPDAHISKWLPSHWHKGPGVDRITFRHLLTHTSGLVLVDQPGPSDYQFMKDQIAIGTVGKPGYRNLNFGLCRILISTIDAPYLFDLLGPGATDKYWDLTTIRYYSRYVSENVYAPAGVTSTFEQTGDNALAYAYPASGPGKSSGDLSTMSGCVAWRLSVDDLLRVMAAFRRLGVIVDPARAQTMLDRKFGLDVKRDTPLGRIYAKGGFWSFEEGRFVEQSNVFFLPKGMELAILANSPLCKPDTGFMDKVLAAIEDNIESMLFAVAITASSALVAFGLFRRARATRRRR
jgi:CubicO group peptidase (beta-lactamase class C family)